MTVTARLYVRTIDPETGQRRDTNTTILTF